MSYSASEQKIYNHLRATLPRFLFQNPDAAEDIAGAYVKIFDATLTQADDWRSMTDILSATGIWLDQHARDRGTVRQEDETDSTLRLRLRTLEDALTEPALVAGVDNIMVDSSALVNLRRDRAFFHDRGISGTIFQFTPDFLGSLDRIYSLQPLFEADMVGRDITIAGNSYFDNNGTFEIVSFIDVQHVLIDNNAASTGMAGTWTIASQTGGFMSRGYRMGHSGYPSTFIIILPYGTSDDVAAAVDEYLRTHKAGGFKHIIEVRQSPP